jgi:uncharacterized phage protein gp47/JayE
MGLIIEQLRKRASTQIQTMLGSGNKIPISQVYWKLAIDTGLSKQQIKQIIRLFEESGKCEIQQEQDDTYLVVATRGKK